MRYSNSGEASRNSQSLECGFSFQNFFLRTACAGWTLGVPMNIMRMLRLFTKLAELTLTQCKANMFDPQHLRGASSDLVQSMFQVGRKAAELERVKLQMEIQKEKSEIRRKKFENRLKMAGKSGG